MEAINFKLKSGSKLVGKQKEQQTVDLGKLPAELGPAVDFLRKHVKDLKGRVLTKGNQIQVEGLKHKEVKLLLHKFLRHKGLDNHRVLSQSGILEIVPPHVTTHPRHDQGTTPPAGATMPYLFPGAPTPVSSGKKSRKKT
ncbi:hypothetical protein AUI06_00450 [archaeon 13_2_20CM_2_52_21]|nr:MAG: hypothetical protein AUI06_00450 [archaeon 13_2_20CM_2_52_21]OLD08215.1 MAG: hypothetical protein AUI95_03740 [Crenarchaeota archaeon 13_1_40CM_3_52_4]